MSVRNRLERLTDPETSLKSGGSAGSKAQSVGVRRKPFVIGERNDAGCHSADRRCIGARHRRPLQERVGSDARRHVREPTRRERCRTTEDEVRCAEGCVLPDEDLPGVDEAIDDEIDALIGDSDLEMFGRVFVRNIDRRIEIADQYAAAIRPERGAGGSGWRGSIRSNV